MMQLEKMSLRYRTDAPFACVVDALQKMIGDANLSPSEVREAAMYAVYLYEMRYPVAVRFNLDEADKQARDLLREEMSKGPYR